MHGGLFKRVIGVVALALALAVAGSPAIASAKAPAEAAASGVAVAKVPAAAAPAASGDVTLAADPCGWYTRTTTAYYNHCASGWIYIVVEFWWGAGDDRWVCVGPGVTNLSSHPSLQGGLITYAYYSGVRC